jgi:hypothetical protein
MQLERNKKGINSDHGGRKKEYRRNMAEIKTDSGLAIIGSSSN